MKITKTKCDQCGFEKEITETTIELRSVFGLYIPQIDREAPMPRIEPQTTLSIYDFCNLNCLRQWIEEGPKSLIEPPVASGPVSL